MNVNKILKSIAVIIVCPFLWRFLLIIIFQLCHQFIKCFSTMTFYNVIIILFCDVIFRARVANETYIVLKHPTIQYTNTSHPPPPPWCSSNCRVITADSKSRERSPTTQHKAVSLFLVGDSMSWHKEGEWCYFSSVGCFFLLYLFLCIAYSAAICVS